ncbi:OpgC domain-containing protein [Methanosarcina sp. T3]|uniref:OpgC domain-containing protein n=1 Tax=Methanosarcina sp. T3 TaxID=3439062 RepID=UPI003F86F159
MVLDPSGPKYKSNSRLHAVDICRGLALLLMIEGHIPQSIGWISDWAFILAGPFFLIISGFSYDLFLSSRMKKSSKKYTFLESFFRGFLIYIIPLIPYIIVGIFFSSYFSSVTGHTYKLNIFHWGIFQIIGAGYILGLVVPNNFKSKILLTISTFIISYIIVNYFSESLTFLISGVFPLFPWIGYFLYGRVAYELYRSEQLKDDKTLLSFSAAFLIISLLICEIFKVNLSLPARGQFPMFLFLGSLHFFIFSILVVYVDHKHFYFSSANKLENIGKICFTAYYIHFLGLFLIQKSVSTFFENLLPAISNLIILLIVVIILVQIEKIWRNYNYRFGFEWLLRKGTEGFLKLSRVRG